MRHLASFIAAVLHAAIAAGALLLPPCHVMGCRAAGVTAQQERGYSGYVFPFISLRIRYSRCSVAYVQTGRVVSSVSRRLGALQVVPADSVAGQGMLCVCLALQHAARSGVTCL